MIMYLAKMYDHILSWNVWSCT